MNSERRRFSAKKVERRMDTDVPIYPNAYRPWDPPCMLYHITSPKNVEGILTNGLHADEDGNIFVFTDILVANTIAVHQLGLDEYALIWVRQSGVTGDLCADDVAEFSRQFQAIIRQPLVAPTHLKYMGNHRVQCGEDTPWERLIEAMQGTPRINTLGGSYCEAPDTPIVIVPPPRSI